jgi:SAM-dependent methyltransferase
MGLDDKGAQFLLAAQRLGVSFERTATIGRQQLFVTARWLRRYLDTFQVEATDTKIKEILTSANGFAEPFLHLLGAQRIVSIDASPYEGASQILDLNQALPPKLESAFTAVIDAGSLEHVFDFPSAIQNCMRMIAPGGHFIAITMGNNAMGHGFYQFSPELFYRVFSPTSGFTVERMLVTETSSRRWYEVADPKVVGNRVQMRSFRPTYLCVAARRLANVPILDTPPQQSDYVTRWKDEQAPREGNHRFKPSDAWFRAVEQYAPYRVTIALKSIYHLFQAICPPLNGRFFRRVDIARLEPRDPG